MTLNDLEQLLCKEFDDCEVKTVSLALNAAQAKLEECLGYELCPNTNFYNEVNKLECEKACDDKLHVDSCPKVTITNEIFEGCPCANDCRMQLLNQNGYSQVNTTETNEPVNPNNPDCPYPEDCKELRDYDITLSQGSFLDDFVVNGVDLIPDGVQYTFPEDQQAINDMIIEAFPYADVTFELGPSNSCIITITGTCQILTRYSGCSPTGATPPDPIFSCYTIAPIKFPYDVECPEPCKPEECDELSTECPTPESECEYPSWCETLNSYEINIADGVILTDFDVNGDNILPENFTFPEDLADFQTLVEQAFPFATLDWSLNDDGTGCTLVINGACNQLTSYGGQTLGDGPVGTLFQVSPTPETVEACPEVCLPLEFYDEPLQFINNCAIDGVKLPLNDECRGVVHRCYDFDPKRPFLNVDPYVRICSVKIVNCETTLYELDECDWEDTRNGNFNAPGWFNSLKICGDLPKPCITPSLACCDAPRDCLKICIGAYWGFGITTEFFEECKESGKPKLKDNPCVIPEDLQYVLYDMVKDEMECNTDLKSETLGAHSYTKFARTLATDKHKPLLDKYAGPASPKRRSPIIC